MWEVDKSFKWIELLIFIAGLIFLLLGSGIELPFGLSRTGYDKSELLFTGFILIGVSIFLVLFGFIFSCLQKRRSDYFIKNGISGMATIVSVETTGTTINYVPQYKIVFKISIQGRPDYLITRKQCVGSMSSSSLVPGFSLPVLVDPKRSKHIYIEL